MSAECGSGAGTLTRELGFDCTDVSAVISVRFPWELANWTMPLLEIIIIGGAVFALVHAINNQPQGKEFLALAGPGFRDSTRIAASDPKMWRDVLLANRHELVEQAKMFSRSLHNMLIAAEQGDGEKLEAMITMASESRQHWRMGQKPK